MIVTVCMSESSALVGIQSGPTVSPFMIHLMSNLISSIISAATCIFRSVCFADLICGSFSEASLLKSCWKCSTHQLHCP